MKPKIKIRKNMTFQIGDFKLEVINFNDEMIALSYEFGIMILKISTLFQILKENR